MTVWFYVVDIRCMSELQGGAWNMPNLSISTWFSHLVPVRRVMSLNYHDRYWLEGNRPTCQCQHSFTLQDSEMISLISHPGQQGILVSSVAPSSGSFLRHWGQYSDCWIWLQLSILSLFSQSEVELEWREHALQAEHHGERRHGICIHHSGRQRLHHSLRHTAASQLVMTKLFLNDPLCLLVNDSNRLGSDRGTVHTDVVYLDNFCLHS